MRELSEIRIEIERELNVLQSILDDHLNIFADHTNINLADSSIKKVMGRVFSAYSSPEQGEASAKIVDAEIRSIRTKCILQLERDFDEQIRRSKNLVKSHKSALRYRDVVPEIFESRFTDRILQERVNCYIRFMSIVKISNEEIGSITVERWTEIIESAKREVNTVGGLSREMAKDVATYRKQLGDDRRERWSRWGLLLGVMTAAFGQANNALDNLKSLGNITLQYADQFIIFLKQL